MAKNPDEVADVVKLVDDISLCFAEDTVVQTADGEDLIQDITVGDLVWSYNEATHQIEINEVARLYRRTADQLIVIRVGDAGIENDSRPSVLANRCGMAPRQKIVPRRSVAGK